jgi:hypothetical protein
VSDNDNIVLNELSERHVCVKEVVLYEIFYESRYPT